MSEVPKKTEACMRAFERRFGKSLLLLKVRSPAPNVTRVFDPETGNWADYDTSAWRIRRIAEHDNQTA